EEVLVLRHLLRVKKCLFLAPLLGEQENVGNLSPLWLEHCRIDQDEMVQDMGTPDRHLWCQPPAHEVADERHLVQTQFLQEPQGEVGEVGEGLQPGRPLGAAEAREDGSINGEVLGKTAVISEPPQIAFDTVEHHQWPALASSQHMDLRSSYFNKLFVTFRTR